MSGSQPVDASKVRWSDESNDLLLGAVVTYRDAGKEYEGTVQVVGEEELTRRRMIKFVVYIRVLTVLLP
eukprot:s577_g5.t1